jgi:hypothetical protein
VPIGRGVARTAPLADEPAPAINAIAGDLRVDTADAR